MTLWSFVAAACLFATLLDAKKLFKHVAITADNVTIETVMEANEPTVCDPNVQQYSGYLKAGGTRNNYFYWFFESRNNPEKSPFIMWLTGGPGCSSQLALLAENGPCTVNDDARTTTLNEYSWTTNANMMWVDQPPGTGFSTGKEVTTELEIQQDMWAFLQNFITQFPQYFTNGFYVIGESYGGHYVPNVMNYIWSQNNKKAGTYIPLKGFAVGNGLTDPLVQFAYYAEMAYNSSSATNSAFSGIPISTLKYNTMTKNIPACQSAIERCNSEMTTSACDNAYQVCMSSEVEPVTETGVNPYNVNESCAVPPLCYDFDAQTTWLNNNTVQAQLGVDMRWESCNTLVNIKLESDWMKEYQSMVVGPLESGVRALIYAGDLDFICNWLGNQAWTLALPWSGKDAFNAATPVTWMANGVAAGEIRQAASNSDFTFLRVYDAGHMVPLDQPAASLAMVNAFLDNTLKP